MKCDEKEEYSVTASREKTFGASLQAGPEKVAFEHFS